MKAQKKSSAKNSRFRRRLRGAIVDVYQSAKNPE